MLVAVLGLSSIVLQQVRTLPQIVRIVRRRDASGVSALTWSLVLVSCLTWFVYGFVFDDPVFIFNNVLTTGGALAVLLAMARCGAASWSRPLIVAAATIVLLWLLVTVGGHTAFAVFATAIGLVMFLPQVYRVFRSSDVSGVSPGTWGLIALSSFSWILYGLATMQPAVLGSHAVIFPSSLAVILRLNLNKRLASTASTSSTPLLADAAE